MRSAPTALENHIAEDSTTIATLWKITRQDATVLGFTDHNADILYDSVTYKAASGFTASAIEHKHDISVDNLDIEGILSSGDITEADIMAGLYDYATVEVFRVNYAAPADGRILFSKGTLGEVKIRKGQFMAEMRSLAQHLQQNIGRIYNTACDAVVGDARCGFSLATASFTVSTTVTSVTSRQKFKASALNGPLTGATNWWALGTVTFTSGANNGLSMEVKYFADTEIELHLPMPYDIEIGDAFTVTAGCDKSFSTCKAKFSNAVNFRGFPHIPGLDKMLETAGTREED